MLSCSVTKWSVKIFLEWQNGRKNKNPTIEPCTFTTEKSKVQRLDTNIANMTVTERLADKILYYYFCAKVNLLCVKLVETTLNIHLPFVSCVLIINQYS